PPTLARPARRPVPLSLRSLWDCDAHDRDLHSFPTRRSSDLVEKKRLGAEWRHILDRKLKWRMSGEEVLDQFEAQKGQRFFDAETDRKSTRLNSSHDQISYAVFCLKKTTAALTTARRHRPSST